MLRFISSACLLAAILMAVPTTLRIAGRPIVDASKIRTIRPAIRSDERHSHRIYNDTRPLNPSTMGRGRVGTSSNFKDGPTISFSRFTATMAVIHYCFGGGPCVSAAQLVMCNRTTTVVPSFTFLGTSKAEATYSKDEETQIASMLSDATISDVDTAPERVYSLFEQHHQGDPEASRRLTECLVNLLHNNICRE